eukprot:g2681.t1
MQDGDALMSCRPKLQMLAEHVPVEKLRSSTLMFDYPTVPDLVDYIYQQVGPAEDEVGAAGAGVVMDAGAMLAIASHAGRYPGCFTNNVKEYWHNMSMGLAGQSCGRWILTSAVGFSKMRGLAFDGRCKTFDQSADGFARGEGIGSVWITRGTGTGENELVSLTGVAINHDGRAATITAPNGTAQQRVLRSALAERQTAGEDVTMIECHGTGTALGDPIEVGAQRAVYGKGRSEAQPLILAATKSNIGHLEGAALPGAGFIFERPSSPVDAIRVPDKLVEWKSASLRSGVSSFGFSGTNGHGLMEATLATEEPAQRAPMKFARKVALQPGTEPAKMAEAMKSCAVFYAPIEVSQGEPSTKALEDLLKFLQAAAMAPETKLLLVVTRGAFDACPGRHTSAPRGSLLLTSRSGRVAEGQKRLQEQLRRLQLLPGVTVQVKACDSSKSSEVAKLLQEGKEANDPVRGGTRDDV